MAFEIKKLKTDPQAEREGNWTEDLGDGLQLKIARMGNIKYVAAVQKVVKKYGNKLGTGLSLDEDEDKQKLIEIYADTILLDWKGLQEDGKDLPYSRLNCIHVLAEYADFFKLVQGLSADAERYRQVFTAESAGNSKAD